MSIEANHPGLSPTVLEMLDEFNTTAHNVFVTALTHYTTGEVHPGLIGKPVNLLQFSVERAHDDAVTADPLTWESLEICVHHPAYVDVLAEHLLYDQQSPLEKARHKQKLVSVDAMRIEENMSFSALPLGTVWAGYRAERTRSHLSVSTYEAPKTDDEFEIMIGMATALFYARDALAYVRSPHAGRPSSEREYANKSGSIGDKALESMIHGIDFVMTPVLGQFLNGKEPPEVLENYQTTMASEYKTACKALDKARREELSDEVPAELVRQYEVALRCVNDILAKRSA